ncbi:MAG: UDP-N-acetylmuramoyl-L-alanyl-D-glutamate--2,6-diaminopimelate ligase, partial [Candidatus Nanopelagicales bacterium]|nr:UDP-N-acetylmuramoyl-L-alanyl-D-glutamate--2,6-diaminopimelate ligase [Candidatus Nanopelagicales bacterium]
MTPDSRPRVRAIALGSLRAGLPTDADISGDASTPISGLELDSRLVQRGDAFAALAGHRQHGVVHIAEALQRGAVAVITDREGWQLWQGMVEFDERIPVLVLASVRPWLGAMAATLHGAPALSLHLLGITGTNGKTTVASMIEEGLRAAGRTTGFIGTTGIHIGERAVESARTTPEATTLQALFALMVEQGVTDAVMEVSSHAMSESRVGGFVFDVVGFTNLSQDHLDYHGTMEEYFDAKAQLFSGDHARAAVVCVDDVWGQRLAARASIPVTTVAAAGGPADWTWEQAPGGAWTAVGPAGERLAVSLSLPGAFNRANALVAMAMLRAVGVSGDAIAQALARVRVPGRLESVSGADALGLEALVDYAHTPDAIARVIAAVREFTPGRVIVVVGAGGDRDAGKRPLMGAMAARLADVVIITDDNPRSEEPASIRAAVLEGARAVLAAADTLA